MEELVREYESLIWFVTKKFPYYPNKDDLFQVGCIGLMESYKNFDPSLGTKFSSYAYFYILGEMKKLVREDKSIKISREITKLNLKIEKFNLLLTQKLGRLPTTKELAEAIPIPESLVIDVINSRNVVHSMEEPIRTNGKEMNYHEVIGDKQEDLDLLLDLKYELQRLSPEEQKFIYERYLRNKTQTEMAKQMNTSQVQVSRKEQKILSKLRRHLTHS